MQSAITCIFYCTGLTCLLLNLFLIFHVFWYYYKWSYRISVLRCLLLVYRIKLIYIDLLSRDLAKLTYWILVAFCNSLRYFTWRVILLQKKVILYFSSKILLTFFLLHYHTKVQWWIKVDIITLASVLGTKWFIFKIIKYVSCRFFINVPYQLRIFSSIPV